MTPPLFTHPLSIFVLVRLNMDSSHNLRMIHEGRTIVTILVSAGVDSVSSGKRLPGPAVKLKHDCVRLPFFSSLWGQGCCAPIASTVFAF